MLMDTICSSGFMGEFEGAPKFTALEFACKAWDRLLKKIFFNKYFILFLIIPQ